MAGFQQEPQGRPICASSPILLEAQHAKNAPRNLQNRPGAYKPRGSVEMAITTQIHRPTSFARPLRACLPASRGHRAASKSNDTDGRAEQESATVCRPHPSCTAAGELPFRLYSPSRRSHNKGSTGVAPRGTRGDGRLGASRWRMHRRWACLRIVTETGASR